MIKRIYLIFCLIFLSLTSCEMRDELRGKNVLNDNEGLLNLEIGLSKESLSLNTRTENQSNNISGDTDNYTVKIVNIATDKVYKQCSYSELKAEGKIKLEAGRYRAEAYSEDISNFTASLTPIYYASNDFIVVAGKTTSLNLVCTLNAFALEINLSNNFNLNFQDDYVITITNGSNANFIYTKDNISKRSYYSVAEGLENIFVSIKATLKSGKKISHTYTITKPNTLSQEERTIKKADLFRININPGNINLVDNPTKVDMGISVNLTWNNSDKEIEIPTENIVFTPIENNSSSSNNNSESGIQITGAEERTFHISNSENESRNVVVNISAPKGIKNLFIQIQSNNSDFNGALASMGLDSRFDMANPGSLKEILSNPFPNGIGLLKPTDNLLGSTSFVFDITSFMGMLQSFGQSKYTFTIEVVDSQDNRMNKPLIINMAE